MQTMVLLIAAVSGSLALAADGDKPTAGNEVPPRVQKARADWLAEGDAIFTGYWRKLRQVKDKHRKSFEKESTEATKGGDLEAAKAWQALAGAFKAELKNVATRESIRLSHELKTWGGARALTDGIGAVAPREEKLYWWGGSQDGPFWLRCQLAERRAIRQIRWCVPLGVAWHIYGQEPLDYDVLLLTAGRVRDTTAIRNGRHPKKEVSQDGKSCWVTLDLKEPVAASEVEWRFKKSSGRSDWCPVFFEVQVFDEPQAIGQLPADARKVPAAEKSWAAYLEEASSALKETERSLRIAREKYRQAAEKEKTEASKKGDLPLALAWENFAKELRPRLENVAPSGKITVSAFSRSFGKPEVLLDRVAAAPFTEPDGFWYGGVPPQKPDWVRLELGRVEPITAVRFSSPVGTRWHRDGHEPVDYDVLLKRGRTIVEEVSVREGKHPKSEPSQDGATQWVTIELPGSPEASEVEIHVSRTSGAGKAPVLFEVEVLAAR